MFRPASPRAALRGAAVGGVSFAASLTAHALAMRGTGSAAPSHTMSGHAMSSMPAHAGAAPTMPGHHMGHAMPALDAPSVASAPSIPMAAVLLLAAACAALGVLAARPRTVGPRAVAALLLVGQGAGHLALGLTMGHLALSPAMALAHVVAAVAAGAVIAGAEHALRVALAVLAPLAPTRRELRRTVVTPVWTFRAVPLPVLARHGALRAPPR